MVLFSRMAYDSYRVIVIYFDVSLANVVSKYDAMCLSSSWTTYSTSYLCAKFMYKQSKKCTIEKDK